MTDTADHFYLPRDQQDALVELLATIPTLVEDLAVTLTRQDRIGSSIRTGRGSDDQPLPYSIHASDAADLLHDTLAAWVRHVTEQRALPSPQRNDTLGLARWLTRWIVALALTPGADEAPGEIRHAIAQARRACDKPREKRVHRPPEETLDAVGLTKDELLVMIHDRTKERVTRKDLDNWIRRGHITTISDGYYSLPSALDYLAQRHQESA